MAALNNNFFQKHPLPWKVADWHDGCCGVFDANGGEVVKEQDCVLFDNLEYMVNRVNKLRTIFRLTRDYSCEGILLAIKGDYFFPPEGKGFYTSLKCDLGDYIPEDYFEKISL